MGIFGVGIGTLRQHFVQCRLSISGDSTSFYPISGVTIQINVREENFLSLKTRIARRRRKNFYDQHSSRLLGISLEFPTDVIIIILTRLKTTILCLLASFCSLGQLAFAGQFARAIKRGVDPGHYRVSWLCAESVPLQSQRLHENHYQPGRINV